MNEALTRPMTAFVGYERLLAGPYMEVALAVKNATDEDPPRQVLTFDDVSGRVVDFDLRGSKADLIARLVQTSNGPDERAAESSAPEPKALPPKKRGRGRPKLGVVAKEVTLLPRHWQWLGAQPGGASATLRRLVEAARREAGELDHQRACQEAAYRFMSALAGNLPGYEEATRALFAQDRDRFEEQIAAWPEHVRAYAHKLAFQEPQS